MQVVPWSIDALSELHIYGSQCNLEQIEPAKKSIVKSESPAAANIVNNIDQVPARLRFAFWLKKIIILTKI